MKKLLSLLSVLTISGTVVPTRIAASPYKKKDKMNDDINYKQTNNLEKLNRIKKEVSKEANWNNDYSDRIQLFIVENIEDQTILNALSTVYPSLDISQIEIVKKLNFEFTSNNIFVKFKVKKDSTKYPKKVFFLSFSIAGSDQIMFKIGREKLIRDWEIGFYIWQDSFNIFKENIKNTDNAILRDSFSEFKLNEFKNQLFNLTMVLEILHNKFRIIDLESRVQILNSTIHDKIKDLKTKITKLNKKVNEILNNTDIKKSLEICGATSGILSGLFGFSIPDTSGVFLSSLSTVIGGFCDLFSINA